MGFTRRDFLEKMGLGAIMIALGSFAAALARFFEPNLTTPAPGPVAIGTPGDYPVGSLTFVEDARVYVGHDGRGLYAMTAVCTHLGCTPGLTKDGQAFDCPCHGSRFARDGQVLNGPATRALEHAFVGRSADERLFVDRSRTVDTDYRLQV